MNVALEQLATRSGGEAPAFDWPAALDGQWCMAPEWLSCHGTSFEGELDDDAKRRLSRFEAASFFSWNIHGERTLLAGVFERLYRDDLDADVEAYLHHFVAEENEHMRMFAEFCRRYAGRIYPDRRVRLGGALDAAEADLIFVGQILCFEEMVDGLNRLHARDERIAPIVRDIHRAHHLDERRHLAFAAEWFRRLERRHAPDLDSERRRRVGDALAGWVRLLRIHRVESEAYADAGLDPRLATEARRFAERDRARVRALLPRTRRLLAQTGLLPTGGDLVA